VIAGPAASLSTVRDLRWHASEALRRAGTENPAREADWLLAPALGLSPLALVVEGGRRLPPALVERAWEFIARRAAREPLQYILGTQEFRGLEFVVTPDVLIPRPETEILVEETLKAMSGLPRPVIADVGTGSGCIAVAVAQECPAAAIFALDLSEKALAIARSNATRHGVRPRIRFLRADLLGACASSGGGLFDVVASNPPYIRDGDLDGLQPEVSRYEPRLALAAGSDGLAVQRRLLAEAPSLLKPGGSLLLELGCGQAEAVLGMARSGANWASVECRTDRAGIERVLIARKAV
jgi:release factor glutamine methyltransferase